jgi:hypothetical protein
MDIIIYVFRLEHSKYFVCSRIEDKKTEVQLLLESEIKYDYLKKYKPIQIINKHEESHPLDVDSYVKQYMIFFGMENVRGGTYSNEILLPHQEQVLKEELSANIENMDDNIVQELISDYADKPFSKQEAIVEIERLEKRYSQYQSEVNFLKKITIDVTKMKENLEWLENTCKAQVDAFNHEKKATFLYRIQIKEDIEKYKAVLKDLKKIYDLFTIDLGNNTQSALFKYPQFVFDDFFYHWHRIHLDESLNNAMMVCSYYNNCIIYIGNRIDEYTFDVNSWGKEIEWKTPRAVYLLQQIIRY